MNESPDKPMAVIIGNFALAAQLPNGRSINVSGYLYEGEGLASVNDRLDLCQEAIERQRHRCEIPELEGKREQMVKALEQVRESLAEMEARQKGGRKLNSQELLNLRNAGVNIQRLDEEIKKGDAAIAAAKQKAGVA